MRKLVLLSIVNFAALYLATLIFPEIIVTSPSSIFWAGFILTLVNFIIRPLIVVVTLPVNLITLGLFTLIINTWMIMLVDKMIAGFNIPTFWTAFGTTIIISGLNFFLQGYLKGKKD